MTGTRWRVPFITLIALLCVMPLAFPPAASSAEEGCVRIDALNLTATSPLPLAKPGLPFRPCVPTMEEAFLYAVIGPASLRETFDDSVPVSVKRQISLPGEGTASHRCENLLMLGAWDDKYTNGETGEIVQRESQAIGQTFIDYDRHDRAVGGLALARALGIPSSVRVFFMEDQNHEFSWQWAGISIQPTEAYVLEVCDFGVFPWGDGESKTLTLRMAGPAPGVLESGTVRSVASVSRLI